MNINVAELKKLFPNNSLTLPDTHLFSGVNKDTRTLNKNEIYVALKGDNFDGHEFVEQAFKRDAAAALVSQDFPDRDNLIRCEDTLTGLQELANYYRKKFTQPLIAITGSNGKTTTKEFLAHVLRQQGKVIATIGNLNNHIGVPLTLLRFERDAFAFIVEMGMNHQGEICTLAKIARPTIGLITSVGHAHLEGVGGTLAHVAKAKGELFLELESSALAVVNADDPLISNLPTRAHRTSYGLSANADIRAENIQVNNGKTKLMICVGTEKIPVTINLVGAHHVRNALAVFAIAKNLGMPTSAIVAGLESFTMELNRGRVLIQKSLTIIDDSYNANPDSMRAAFESLALQFPEKKRIAVLGGMMELGIKSPELHAWVGEQARLAGIHDLYVLGENAEKYLAGFGMETLTAQARFFSDPQNLAKSLTEDITDRNNIVVLIKGSRHYAMERVIPFL